MQAQEEGNTSSNNNFDTNPQSNNADQRVLSRVEKERIWRAQKKKIKKQKQKENQTFSNKFKERQLEDEKNRQEKEKLQYILDQFSQNQMLFQQDEQEQDQLVQQQQQQNDFQGLDLEKDLIKQLEQEQLEEEQKENEQEQQQQQNEVQELSQGEGGDQDDEDEEDFLTGRYYEEFKDVFKNFKVKSIKQLTKIQENHDENAKADEERKLLAQQQKQEKKEKLKEEKLQREQKISRKKKKQLRWLKVAELKGQISRPDLVEAWDITAPDPFTLVYMKSLRNTVPVPKHWAQKRRFLAGRRGFQKVPFKLPPNIENTGISQLRDPFVVKGGAALVKQKLKERMNPKMGKIDIDYQVLHDAFFKYQTKPKLTIHGDIYFEGKEEEYKSREFKPGKLSGELRAALGIADFQAPPWYMNMQRYGPPPSYPYLKLKIYSPNDNMLQGYGAGNNDPGVYATFRQPENNEEEEDGAEEYNKQLWGVPIDEQDDYPDEDNIQDEEEEQQDQEQNFNLDF